MKQATITIAYELTGLGGGRRAMLKLWQLNPRCGDGERCYLGVADAMGVQGVQHIITREQAESRARVAGFTVLL